MLDENAKKIVGNRLQAFSVWYPDDPIDESVLATIMANRSGAELNIVYARASELWQDLQELVRAPEEPFGEETILRFTAKIETKRSP